MPWLPWFQMEIYIYIYIYFWQNLMYDALFSSFECVLALCTPFFLFFPFICCPWFGLLLPFLCHVVIRFLNTHKMWSHGTMWTNGYLILVVLTIRHDNVNKFGKNKFSMLFALFCNSCNNFDCFKSKSTNSTSPSSSFFLVVVRLLVIST